MSANLIAKKLRMKSGMRALIVGAPPGYLKLLSPLPAGVTVCSVPDGLHPFVQLFATSVAEIRRTAPRLLTHTAERGLVWITYPKKTSGIKSDLDRDTLRELFSEMGWSAVSIVAIDEVWSALRFRPTADVESR